MVKANSSDTLSHFLGEFIGTFMLTLFGCGSVMCAVVFNAFSGLFQIAMIWGIGVCIAIYACRHMSCAHFNPAVTLAMAFSGRMKKGKVPCYLLGQFTGAFAASGILYLLFASSLASAEQAAGILRGSQESVAFAKAFGEYYSLPGAAFKIPLPVAAAAEFLGTFVLVFVIYSLTEGCNVGRPDNNLAPMFIGLTVTILISIFAPLSQAGFNPARDFAPRLVALIAGYKAAAFPDAVGGFFWVYILAPCIGGLLAGLLFTKIIEPTMNRNNKSCSCK